MSPEEVEALETLAELWRPLCRVHNVPMFWQEGWVAPGWVCGPCLESTPEEA